MLFDVNTNIPLVMAVKQFIILIEKSVHQWFG